jgi:iron complex outermembrane recepter protein
VRSTILSFSISAFTLAAAPFAWSADGDLEEIFVTASLAGTALDDLPASVTVLSGESLRQAGDSHFADVLGQVPNLFFAGGTSRPRYFQIRGIGELEQYEGAPNSSVGFLIDDIDFSGIGMPAALFDLQQVEVLRGPQGTAYGANALAGLINLRSQAPRDLLELRGELEVGNYGSRAGGLIYNDSSADGRNAWRVALHRSRSNGFRHNAFLGRDDTNGFDESLARVRFRSHLTSVLDMNLTLLVSDADNGYDAWAIDNSRVTQSDKPGVDQQLSRALAARFDYTGWDNLTLRSITTVADAGMKYSFDGDWGNDPFWGVNGPYDFFEEISRERRNVSQELRLSSLEDGANSWIAGVYALNVEEDYSLLDLYNGDVDRTLDSRYRALNLAAYGQIDRALADSVRLSTGLRFEHRDARYRDSNALSRSPQDSMVGGHVSLTWGYADDQSAYVALTRGYKAGGINTGASIPDELREFDPESAWNLEAGWRGQTADGRLSGRTTLFYMRRQEQQVSSSNQANLNDPLTFVLLTDNAASGENFGLESELTWQAHATLQISAQLALLQARFIDYTIVGETAAETRVLDGRDQPHAPNYQLGLSLDWSPLEAWHARADFQAVDGIFFSASHDERAAGYELLNLRVGYETERWAINAYVRNALNERYDVRGFFFGNEPPDYENKRYVQNGDPRQVGVKLSFSF